MTVPSLRRCLRETSVRKARRSASEAGRFAADAGSHADTGRAATPGFPNATLRWYSCSTQAWVAVLSRSSVSAGSPSSMGKKPAFDLSPERFLFSVLLG